MTAPKKPLSVYHVIADLHPLTVEVEAVDEDDAIDKAWDGANVFSLLNCATWTVRKVETA